MLFKNTVSPECFRLLTTFSTWSAVNNFSLAGGTSLSLRIGHRISIDLDFFSQHDFDSEKLSALLSQQFNVDTFLKVEKNTVNLIIDDVKVQFLGHLYPTLKDFEVTEGIRHYSFEDITAMKLNAIAGRGDKKDFIDYSFLLENFSPIETYIFFQLKYHQRDPMHLLKSLTYFNDADNQPAPNLIIERSWQDVKNRVLSAQRDIVAYLAKTNDITTDVMKVVDKFSMKRPSGNDD